MRVLTGKDIIALVVIIGFFVTAYTRPQIMVPSAIMLVVGYYFARREDAQVQIPPSMIKPAPPVELKGKDEIYDQLQTR